MRRRAEWAHANVRSPAATPRLEAVHQISSSCRFPMGTKCARASRFSRWILFRCVRRCGCRLEARRMRRDSALRAVAGGNACPTSCRQQQQNATQHGTRWGRRFRLPGAQRRSGQATIEYAILYAGVILPLTFAIVFAAEMLWVWHSVVDFTRDGARYATTHCWTANGDNVMTYMRSHVPRMIDMDQFQQGQAELAVTYYSRDPDTGSLVDFTCASGECSVDCIPDAVTVRVS